MYALSHRPDHIPQTMKKFSKAALLFLTAAFIGIQAVPVDRSNPPVITDLEAPAEVKKIIRRSCYDCHSNEVQWPWYSRVAPISWLVAYDVEEGREDLNFSDWDTYANDRGMIEEIIEEIEEGDMPLRKYLITHPNASVSKDELNLLRQWAGVSRHSHEDHHDED